LAKSKLDIRYLIADWLKPARYSEAIGDDLAAKVCHDVVKSYEIELETGIPVCVCHFRPMVKDDVGRWVHG
jgi:hypothetical protein